MSELKDFVEEAVEPEVEEAVEVEAEAETPEEEQPEPEQAEPEAEAEGEAEPEGLPTEPDKESGTVPIAALLDEREKRQAAIKHAKELEARLSELQKGEARPVPDVFENPDAFVSHFQQQMQNEAWNTRVTMSQDMMRILHDDYDEAEAKFLAMGETMPELAAQLRQAPNPAKFVYESVKKAEKLEQMQNVDEWEAKKTAEIEAKVRQELEAQYSKKAADKAAKAGSLTPSLTNTRADGGNRPVVGVSDPLESTFNR